MTSQELVTARALDCSQIADWSRAIGWDIDYQQIGCGAFDASFSVVGCGQLKITRQVCNRDVAIKGVPPQDMLSVVLPIGGNGVGVYQGVQLRENEGIVLRPEAEGFLKSPAIDGSVRSVSHVHSLRRPSGITIAASCRRSSRQAAPLLFLSR